MYKIKLKTLCGCYQFLKVAELPRSGQYIEIPINSNERASVFTRRFRHIGDEGPKNKKYRIYEEVPRVRTGLIPDCDHVYVNNICQKCLIPEELEADRIQPSFTHIRDGKPKESEEMTAVVAIDLNEQISNYIFNYSGPLLTNRSTVTEQMINASTAAEPPPPTFNYNWQPPNSEYETYEESCECSECENIRSQLISPTGCLHPNVVERQFDSICTFCGTLLNRAPI